MRKLDNAADGHGRRGRAALAVAVAVLAVLASLLGQPANAAADRKARINVVHGIPGVAVKVCVDGKPAIRDFRYGEKVVGAALPAGAHRVRVVPAAEPCSSPAVLKARYHLDAGKNYTLVAARRPSGAAALAAFVNRVRPTEEGKARLTVRHTAAAPAVNVWAGSAKLVGGKKFTWGDQKTLAVPKGDYRVKVTLPGDRKPVIGPRHLTLRAGNAYQVHAVGTADRYRLVVVRVRVGTH
jgi:hypothetical protein